MPKQYHSLFSYYIKSFWGVYVVSCMYIKSPCSTFGFICKAHYMVEVELELQLDNRIFG